MASFYSNAPDLDPQGVLIEDTVKPETVVIEFSSVWCTIVSENSELLHAYLYKHLSYQVENYFFSPKFQMGVWDGCKHFYQPKTHRFRVGMLRRAIEILKTVECSITIRNFPDYHFEDLQRIIYKNVKGETVIMRQYQQDAALVALNDRFGIIQAPPRAGKTLIATAIIDNGNEYPANFFVRSKDLAYQAQGMFLANFPDKKIGFICDGICDLGDINVITVQSAYSAYNKKYDTKVFQEEKAVEKKMEVKKLIAAAKIVFMDESHHSGSDTAKFIFDKCTKATMKIGLSATPFSDKAEAMLTEEVIGRVISEIGYSYLIKMGYLMKPYIYLYKLPRMSIDAPYQTIYKQAVVDNVFLTKLVAKLVRSLNNKGKSVVIQTDYVSHSKNLAKYLNCEFLTGADNTEKRERIKQQLTDKEILCLVSTLFEEGIDVPTLDYTINLAGGLSNITTFQRMRSITTHESKTTIGIIDFIHQCKYLKDHSKKRLGLYESEPEFVVEIRDVSKMAESEL